MTDRKYFFDQPVKNDWETYHSIQKTAIGKQGDYTNSYSIDYNYVNKYYKMIAVSLSKQHALDANGSKSSSTSFSLLKKQIERFRIFHKKTVMSL